MLKKYPFKFLESYSKEDKDFFFGRTTEVDDLYKMIFKTKIVVVYGTSGTGKTSLIQCGLANKFNSYDWLSLYVRRGSNLIESLDKTLCEKSGGAFEYINDQEKGIKHLTEKIEAVYKDSLRPIYLIFDQFEELYVIGSKKEQHQFIKAIKTILSIERPVKVILSIREEYLGYLYEFEKEVPQLLRRKLRVEPMNIDKIGDVTRGINSYDNSLVKIKVDEIDKITEEIFEKVKGKKEKSLTIQLPYLQVFLDKLYINQTDDHSHKKSALITMQDLKKIGNIDNVMQDFLVQQVKEMEEELKVIDSDTIWTILSDFCTLEGTKEPISKKKLSKGLLNIDKKIIYAVVDNLEKHRILRHIEESDLYELSHDSLALKIMERRSADVVKMLEVKRFIKSKASLTGDLRVLFTEREMIYLEPHLEKIGAKLGASEKKFLKESQENIETEKRNEIERQETDSKKRLEEQKLIFKKKRRRIYVIAFLASIIFVIGGVFLQRAYLKGMIDYDKLVVEEIINSTESKLENASNLMATNPTKALVQDGNTLLVLDKLEREEPYQRLKNRDYGWFAGILLLGDDIDKNYNELVSVKDKRFEKIKKHGEMLLNENQALYESIAFKEPKTDRYTMSGIQALNLIFPDSINPEKFQIWGSDKVMLDSIKKYEKNLAQVVFPLYTSDAIGLDKNGNAGFFRKNKAFNALKMEDLYEMPGMNSPISVNCIAPITYQVIGYKLLTALDNERIVEWNLNGTIRHNNEVDKESPVIYKKQDIQLGDKVVSIAISSRRHKIFTATDKGIGVMWLADTSGIKIKNSKKIAFSLEQDIVLCSSFSKDGSMIATGSSDHSVAIWSDDGRLIKKLKGHSNPVTSVAFSAKNEYLYTGSSDGSYKKWKLPNNINSASDYSRLKWHSIDKFDSIYEIKTQYLMDYQPPSIYE